MTVGEWCRRRGVSGSDLAPWFYTHLSRAAPRAERCSPGNQRALAWASGSLAVLEQAALPGQDGGSPGELLVDSADRECVSWPGISPSVHGAFGWDELTDSGALGEPVHTLR